MIVTNKISIFNLLPKGQRRPWHPPLTAPLGTDWHSRQELGTPAWAWWDQDPGVAGAAAGLRSCPLLGDVTRPCPRIGRRSRAGWSPLPSLVGVGTAGASPPWALTPRWLKEPRREGGLQLPPQSHSCGAASAHIGQPLRASVSPLENGHRVCHGQGPICGDAQSLGGVPWGAAWGWDRASPLWDAHPSSTSWGGQRGCRGVGGLSPTLCPGPPWLPPGQSCRAVGHSTGLDPSGTESRQAGPGSTGAATRHGLPAAGQRTVPLAAASL